MTQTLTKEQLVAVLDKYLFEWEYKDIERASVKGEAKLAGFILGACFIDALAFLCWYQPRRINEKIRSAVQIGLLIIKKISLTT